MTEEFTFIIGGPTEFSFGEVEIKGEKKYYVTGYISTKDLDLVNDIVTEEGLQDMVNQINDGNIKLDVDHEAWSNNEGPNILPIGRIIEAKYDAEGQRVWVKALLNSTSDRFKKIWSNIKNKFLDAFSIAFKPIRTVTKIINGKEIRLLEKVLLLNVALTGNPANPEARIQNVFAKSLTALKEEDNMTEIEQKSKDIVEETPEEVVEEAQAEEAVEEKSFEEDLKALKEELTKNFEEELKKLREDLSGKNEELKSLKEKLDAPQFKALVEEKPDEPEAEVKKDEVLKTPLQLI